MEKKIIVLFLLLLFSFYLVNISYATNTGIVYLESNKDTIEKGEEIEITVNLKDAKTSAFNLSLYFDNSKLEYISNSDNTNVIENRIIFVWFDSAGGSGSKDGEVARFKFKAIEDGLVTFTVLGEFYSQTGQMIKTDFKEKQVEIGKEETLLQQQANEEHGTDFQSSNASLQVLRVDKEGITPNFDSNIYEYYLIVPSEVNNIDVLTISENPNAFVEVTGNDNLKEGLNTISIKITSEDKTQNKVYTIQVTKTSNLDLANTNLEILAIESFLLNPPFNVSESNYKTEVSNEINSINVLAIPENENAVVDVVGKDNLKDGNNLLTVTVTVSNGFTKRKYIVEVYKRNEEEEKRYQEEQKKQIEKVKQAYEIEELNGSVSENQIENELEHKKENKNVFVWVIVIVLFVIIVVFCMYFNEKK